MSQPGRRTASPRGAVALAGLVLVAVFVTAFIGIELTRGSGRIASIWLANAVVLLALLRTSRRRWPVWLLCGLAGNLAANFTTGDAGWMATVLALCNSFEIFLAGWLFRRWNPSPSPDLTQSKALFTFICAGGAIAPAASGLLAALLMHAHQGLPFWGVFRSWFAGDALGLLIIVPLFAGAAAEEFAGMLRSPARLEAAAILVLPPALTITIVLGHHFPWLFLLGPVFLWAAFRFGLMGVASAICLVAASGIGTLVAVAPQAGQIPDLRSEIGFLQLFLFTNVVIFLPVANLLRSLRAGEECLRLAMEATRDGFWDWDLTTGQIFFSPNYNLMLGLDPRDAQKPAGTWRDLLHPDDREGVLAEIQACIEGPRQTFEVEHRIRTREGGIKWILGRGKAVGRNARGHALRLTGTTVDITERKQAELRLMEVSQLNETILRSTQEGIVVYDPELRYVVWNSHMERLSGTPAGELVGRKPLDLYPFLRETGVMERLEKALAGIKSDSVDYFYQFPSTGKSGWAIDSTAPMFNPKGEIIGVIRTLRDITDRKRTEEENARFQAQLQHTQKMESMGTLVAGVAHNINNVLAIAMGTASLREQSATGPADREAYRNILKVCARGREVVKSLSHFAQPTPVAQAPIDLNLVIQEVCALLESTTGNQIEISRPASEKSLWINGNSGDLTQVLVNLGVNALEAMPGGGSLTFRTAVPKENLVEVSVSDTGTGMTPEVLAHVMEPFFTTREVGQGTGLGLSMAYGVVKAHGGSIDLASQPGQGTTVSLRFPMIPAPARVEPVLVEAPVPTLASMRVFLVDDDEDVRFLMTRMLRKAGVRHVRVFSGGREVLEGLPMEELPDLIILDQNMPGMSGAETMARIRSLHPGMPILISSGQPDIEAWEAFKLAKVGVISKPFTTEEILAKLALFVQGPSSGQ